MVYDHLLPENRKITYTFSESWGPKGTTITLACRADPDLRKELLAWAARRCNTLRLVITDDGKPPSAEMIANFTDFELLIDSYDLSSGEVGIRRLHENIKTLVATLARCHKLKSLTAEFSEPEDIDQCDEKRPCSSPYWCMKSPSRTGNTGNRLHTKDEKPFLNTLESTHFSVVEYLLEPFIELPACESVCIRGLQWVKVRPDWIFDADWLFASVTGFKNWLLGYRDDSSGNLRKLAGQCSMCTWREGDVDKHLCEHDSRSLERDSDSCPYDMDILDLNEYIL